MDLDQLACRFDIALPAHDEDELRQVFALFVDLLDQERDRDWLVAAMLREPTKWLVARTFFFSKLTVHPILFEPMMDAAVSQTGPSHTNHFLAPCLKTFGQRRVVRALLDRFRDGNDLIRDGVMDAEYWAFMGLVSECDGVSDMPDPIDHSLRCERNVLIARAYHETSSPALRERILTWATYHGLESHPWPDEARSDLQLLFAIGKLGMHW